MLQKQRRKFFGSFCDWETGCMIRVGARAVVKYNNWKRTRPVWFPKESFKTHLPAGNNDCFRNMESVWPITSATDNGANRNASALTLKNYLATFGYFAMQTFLGSVKNLSASSPPSRPTPLCFMPPKGTRRSRTNQQFTQTVPVLIRSATRWARLKFCVQTLDDRPYSMSLA